MDTTDTCATVKVKSWGEGQGDYVEINEGDFDEKVHKKLTAAELRKLDEKDGPEEPAIE